LHKALGVGRDFTNWIKGRIDQYGFIAGTDFIRVENLSSPKRASAKTRQQIEHDYLLSLDMAKEVAMVERNEQGRAVRVTSFSVRKHYSAVRTAQYRRQLKPVSVPPTCLSRCAQHWCARAEQGKQTQAPLQQREQHDRPYRAGWHDGEAVGAGKWHYWRTTGQHERRTA
jgi:phage anti-repressor protein